jgi:hypothetical protein
MNETDRSLIRLRQIALEEEAAATVGDVEELCRLTELLPAALEELASALEKAPRAVIRNRHWLEEIQASHSRAEKYLEDEMRAVRAQLNQFTTARTTLRAYGRMAKTSDLDHAG